MHSLCDQRDLAGSEKNLRELNESGGCILIGEGNFLGEHNESGGFFSCAPAGIKEYSSWLVSPLSS
jgi:hypothetical protein